MVFPLITNTQVYALLYVRPLQQKTICEEYLHWWQWFASGLFKELQEVQNTIEHPKAKIIDQWCQHHSSDGSDLNDLAKYLHLSKDRCSHLIKELFGESFSSRIANVKLNRAKAHLQNSTMSCEEIATRLGYNSSAAFSSFFKKREQCSPLQLSKAKMSD